MSRPDLGWLTARPIAHRGLHDVKAGVVENTLGAFSAAIAKGYAIECDLQISGDGEAVLFHDDTLDRVMRANGAVKSFTVAELKRQAFKHSSEQIPTLGEMLALVDGKVPLVIELKPQWDGDTALAARTIDVLRTYRGPYCLMSFDPGVIEVVRTLSPETPRGMISDSAQDPYYGLLPRRLRQDLQTLGYLQRTRPDFMSIDHMILPWAPIAALRQAGMPIITWTIRNKADAERALHHCDQITFEGYAA